MTATQVLELAKNQDGNISIGDAMTVLYSPLADFVLEDGHAVTKVFDAARMLIIDLKFPINEIDRMLNHVGR